MSLPLTPLTLGSLTLDPVTPLPEDWIDVSSYAVGDGIANDTTAFEDALAADNATALLYSPPGKTYLITGNLTIATQRTIDFSGSTIKFATPGKVYVTAAGAGTYIRNLVVDANLQVGGGGVSTDAVGVTRCFNVETLNSKGGSGFACTGAGVILELNGRCHSHHHQRNAGSHGNGAYALNGAILRTGPEFLAEYCQGHGVLIDTDAGEGCVIRGRAYRCGDPAGAGSNGAYLRSPNGIVDFVTEECDSFGVEITGDKWRGFAEALRTGVGFTAPTYTVAPDDACAGIRIFAADNCKVYARDLRSGGYGVAIVGGSNHNDITVDVDYTGGSDRDPGINLSGGSSFNVIRGEIRGATVGLSMAEATGLNNDNDIVLAMFDCDFSALRMDYGKNNAITIFSRNNRDFDDGVNLGLVNLLGGANVTGNRIVLYDHRETTGGAAASTCPRYLVRCLAGTADNEIIVHRARDCRILSYDLGTNNKITVAKALKQTAIATFDSGEAWSAGTNNATAGQWVEGDGGKRFLGGVGSYTSYTRTLGAAIDLSAMGNEEWFRVWCFYENAADHLTTGSGPVLFRLRTDSSNYFDTPFGNPLVPGDGGFYIYLRKVDFSAVGTPNWNNITSIAVLVHSAGAGTFAVTMDDFCRVYSQRFEGPSDRAGGSVSVADGGKIAHGLLVAPTRVTVVPSVSGEFASVTAIDASSFTVALKKHDNTAGTTQSVYWTAER
jgi:hypothetical protein